MTAEEFVNLSKEEKLKYYQTELIPKIKWGFDDNNDIVPSNVQYLEYDGYCDTYALTQVTNYFYRIKPEPKYTHFTYEDRKMFMGKEVRHKTNKINYVVVGCHDEQLFIGENWVCYNIAFKHYVFADGSPFGKKVQS